VVATRSASAWRAGGRRALAIWAVLLLVAVAALGVAIATQPASTTPAARIATLEREVRCLSCGELDVAQSKSAEAYSMAAYIRHEVQAGASNQQILDALVASYGDGILMAPPATGLAVYLWLLPVVVGGGLAVELVRTARRRPDGLELASGGSVGVQGEALPAPPKVVPARPACAGRRHAPRTSSVPRWMGLAGAGLMLGAAGVGIGLWISRPAGPTPETRLAAQLRLGETLAAVGATASAERAFASALAIDPANPTALAYEGWLRFNTAHDPRARSAALAMLDVAARRGPRVAVAQLFDGFGLFYGRHDTAAALARLRAYLVDSPPRLLSREAAPLAAPIYASVHEPLPRAFRS